MNPTMRFAVRGEGSETLELDVYDDIGERFWGEGVTAKSVRKTLQSSPAAKTIRLRVNSRGGDVFDGWAIYSLLADHPARVEADVDALAASMASVILMAADEIRVAAGAMIMVHNPWVYARGEASDLRTVADRLDKMRGALVDAYAARTGLSHDQLIEMMDAETWMTADEAAAFGFADEVKPMHGGNARAFASLDLSPFSRPPPELVRAVAAARTEPPTRPSPSDPRAGASEEKNRMDLRELRARHPHVYEAAVAAGVQQERDRVCAHLELGEQSGATAIAFASIREGSAMTQTLTARYLAAGMNRAEQLARQAETDAVGTALDGAQPQEEPMDLVDRAAAAFLSGAAADA